MQSLWIFLFCNLQIDSVTLQKAQEFLFHIILLETAASAYRVYGVDIFGTLSLLAALQGDIQLNFKYIVHIASTFTLLRM